jgi:hypothetical protein
MYTLSWTSYTTQLGIASGSAVNGTSSSSVEDTLTVTQTLSQNNTITVTVVSLSTNAITNSSTISSSSSILSAGNLTTFSLESSSISASFTATNATLTSTESESSGPPSQPTILLPMTISSSLLALPLAPKGSASAPNESGTPAAASMTNSTTMTPVSFASPLASTGVSNTTPLPLAVVSSSESWESSQPVLTAPAFATTSSSASSVVLNASQPLVNSTAILTRKVPHPSNASPPSYASARIAYDFWSR